MKKIMVVFGTRPEAIKMCPLVKELKKSETLETVTCVTGQHKEMLQQVLDVFDIVPDYNLDIMKAGQDLFDITSAVLLGMRDILNKVQPDIVLVHGDTTTRQCLRQKIRMVMGKQANGYEKNWSP